MYEPLINEYIIIVGFITITIIAIIIHKDENA